MGSARGSAGQPILARDRAVAAAWSQEIGSVRLTHHRLSTGQIESGSWAAALSGPRVAIMAHWSEDHVVSRSVTALLHALRERDFRTVLVSTTEGSAPLVLPEGGADLILRRPNVAYDFGSWAHAIAACPELTTKRTVLLVNDSLVGPFASLDRPFDHLESSRAMVWGLVASDQFAWHLQSYFLAFQPEALRLAPVARFWRGVRQLGDKQRIIHRYEIGLSQLLVREAITVDSYVPTGLAVAPGLNPMMSGWRRMLDLGVPLVKRELVRSPELALDGRDLAREVQARYGTDVTDWIGAARG